MLASVNLLSSQVRDSTKDGANQKGGYVYAIIVDSLSAVPIQGVTVRVDGTTKGAISNKMGIIRLKLNTPTFVLKVTRIGYQPKSISCAFGTNDTLSLTVQLTEKATSGQEIVVSGIDPGVKLLRRCIERRLQQIDTLNSYAYSLYTKFSASADTLTAGRNSGRGDTAVISIFESFSDGYFQKPDSYFNQILQRRQTANIPAEANIVAFGTNLNAYDEYVTFFNEQVATPFHPSALDYYDPVIIRRYQDDSINIAVVRITPKTSQRKLFDGEITINENTAQPISVVLTTNKTVQLPFDAKVRYEQTFQTVQNCILPLSLKLESSVNAEILFIINPRLDISIQTLATGFVINPVLDSRIFEQRRIEVSSYAEKFDSTFWNENSVIPLRPEELSAYQEIEYSLDNPDSNVTSGLFDRIFGWIPRTLATFNRKPFTGIEDIFRFNRVHGLYLGVGVRDDILTSKNGVLEAALKCGYGFSDKRWYGEGSVQWFFDTTRKFSIAGTGYSRLSRRDNPYVPLPLTVTTLALLNRNDYGDYYYNEGAEIMIEGSYGQRRFIRNGIFARPAFWRLGFRHELHSSATTTTTFGLTGRKDFVRDNPMISNGTLQSISLDLGWNYSPYRRLIQTGQVGANLMIEHASPTFTGSPDFNFSLAHGSVLLRTSTLPLWRLDARLSAGWVWGTPPPQRYFSLESAISGIASEAVFRGMNIKEFYGNQMVALSLEHSFGEVIPGVLRIPNIASFGIEFIGIGRAGWTNFSQTISPAQLLQSTSATADKYYGEIGFGINKLLLFFRIDITARYTQRFNPQFWFTLSGATF